jgi:hypothetical protein
MVSKRKRTATKSAANGQGLAAGEVLKRNTLAGNMTSPWGWAGTEVLSAAGITAEHKLATCGLASRNKRALCANKYALTPGAETSAFKTESSNMDDDVIEVADEDTVKCSKRTCKSNPFCLNHLGQTFWEDEGLPFRLELDSITYVPLKTEHGTSLSMKDAKDPELPVGLRVSFLNDSARERVCWTFRRTWALPVTQTRHSRYGTETQLSDQACTGVSPVAVSLRRNSKYFWTFRFQNLTLIMSRNHRSSSCK